MLQRGPTDPFPISVGAWQRGGGPQQNLPLDDVPGLESNGLSTSGNATTMVRRQIPFWEDPPATLDPSNAQLSPWDVVVLGGQALPGICSVTGKRGKRYDLKKVKGSDFAKLTKQGYEPAEIRITERIWTRQQFYALQLIMPMLEAPTKVSADGTVAALEIRHPALDLRSINSVVVKEISLLRPGSMKGVFEMDITCLEYKPPSKTNSTATVDGATYNVKTLTNQMFSKGKFRAPQPFTNTGPNGGRGG